MLPSDRKHLITPGILVNMNKEMIQGKICISFASEYTGIYSTPPFNTVAEVVEPQIVWKHFWDHF